MEIYVWSAKSEGIDPYSGPYIMLNEIVVSIFLSVPSNQRSGGCAEVACSGPRQSFSVSACRCRSLFELL